MNFIIKIYNKNVSITYIKILIIISCLSYFINIYISNIKFIMYYLESQKELIKNENIFKFSNNNKLKILKIFKKSNKPVISIISPVYNSEKYILRLLKSLQKQTFIEIEIILIDDASIDNSIKIIEKIKIVDQRIILIKNKKNKGTFINRNIGVLYSKGKYIILPDPDDIITKNILNLCYKYVIKYKVEMIRFNIYLGKGVYCFNDRINKIKYKLINQPELSTNLFYGNNELETIDCFITNKFIKKEVYIKAINSLNNFYLNLYITFMEDSLLNYILYRTAKSFIFLPKSGYYYIKSAQSITLNLFKISILRMKCIFIFLDIIFKFSKNSKYEKDIANLYITNIHRNFNLLQKLSTIFFNNNFYLYYKIIKLYLNSSFINRENINIFKQIKNIIINNLKKKKLKKKIN